jgi:hypothetical protein
MQLHETWGHHREVRHHVTVAEERAEGSHRVGNSSASFHNFLICPLRVDVPFPSIFKRHDLSSSAGAVLLREKNVVVLTAVERRVEVDEVYRLIADIATKHIEVVAVIEFVVRHDRILSQS